MLFGPKNRTRAVVVAGVILSPGNTRAATEAMVGWLSDVLAR